MQVMVICHTKVREEVIQSAGKKPTIHDHAGSLLESFAEWETGEPYPQSRSRPEACSVKNVKAVDVRLRLLSFGT